MVKIVEKNEFEIVFSTDGNEKRKRKEEKKITWADVVKSKAPSDDDSTVDTERDSRMEREGREKIEEEDCVKNKVSAISRH